MTAPVDVVAARASWLEAWYATGSGLGRVYTHPAGWTVVKDRGGQAWLIRRPDGRPADEWSWPSLLAAQLQAFRYATADVVPAASGFAVAAGVVRRLCDGRQYVAVSRLQELADWLDQAAAEVGPAGEPGGASGGRP